MPRLSFATTYAPPLVSYARTVCVYERTTIARTAAIAIEMGRTRWSADDRDGDEDHHRGLRRVGDRRERVGREDRQREGLRDQRVVELAATPAGDRRATRFATSKPSGRFAARDGCSRVSVVVACPVGAASTATLATADRDGRPIPGILRASLGPAPYPSPVSRLRPQRLLLIEPPWRGHLVAGLFSLGAVAVVSCAVFVARLARSGRQPRRASTSSRCCRSRRSGACPTPCRSPSSACSSSTGSSCRRRHSFRLADSENWVVLAVYLVTAISVSGSSARAQRRAADAEQQRARGAARSRHVCAPARRSGRAELPRHDRRARGALARRRRRQDRARRAGPRGRRAGSAASCGPAIAASASSSSTERRGRTPRSRGVCAPCSRPCLQRPSTARRSHTRRGRARLVASGKPSRRKRSRRSDAAKTAVLRSVSHDLRSPITAITTAERGPGRDGESSTPPIVRSSLPSSSLEARRLDRLVAQPARALPARGGSREPLPRALAGRRARRARPRRGRRGRGPRRRRLAPGRAPPVEVDPAQIERALVNVLENALKFSPRRAGEVRRAERGRSVVVRVVDRGPGIPARERERIFERFVRGERGRGGHRPRARDRARLRRA